MGYFIGIEGIDGSGKTTLVEKLSKYFIAKKINVYLSKEPGDNPIGRAHRELSLMDNVPPYSAALISTADRYFNMPSILTKLNHGFIVISDRYYISGLAYHAAENISFEDYSFLNRKIIKPNMYLFLELSLTTALERKKSTDRWEKLREKVYLKYYEALHFLKEEDEDKIFKIDASALKKDVFSQVLIILYNQGIIKV